MCDEGITISATFSVNGFYWEGSPAMVQRLMAEVLEQLHKATGQFDFDHGWRLELDGYAATGL